MSVSWVPVLMLDILGSLTMLLLAGWSALLAWRYLQKKPDDVFRNYLFLFTLAIVFFAVSRSFGHLVKQLLLVGGHDLAWARIAPFSGAVNTTTFVVIFAFGIYFQRFRTVHTEIEYFKHNLESMIEVRTSELEKANNTLENILNNSNPICITGLDFELLRANDAFYGLWPAQNGPAQKVKCYESRPGTFCHTEDCPLRQIRQGVEFVSHEVTKTVHGKPRDFIAVSRPFRDVDGKLIGMVESFQDITALKRAEKAMRETEERFRLIFAANPDPVVLARLVDGAIIDVNPAFESATGIPRAEALGHNSEELSLWAEPGMRDMLRTSLQERGEVNNLEVEFRVQRDEIKTGLVSVRLLHLTNEPCLLLVVRDITTEKAAEQALIETDRVKSEFISTAAHELNTPLSAILGYSEFLRNPEEYGGFSDAQQRDFIEEIHERGEALCRIVDDLLDISRIESGRPVPLELQETDIADVLSKKVKFFTLEKTRHHFCLELPENPQQTILVIDRHRINQVLDNLITNAVKYSAAGKEIRVVGKEQPQGWEITVSDQGVGMSPEQLERIFEKFYRVDATDTAIGGLGLGMSIVKQFVEAHGGTIRIESVEGEGTSVSFTLPGQFFKGGGCAALSAPSGDPRVNMVTFKSSGFLPGSRCFALSPVNSDASVPEPHLIASHSRDVDNSLAKGTVP